MNPVAFVAVGDLHPGLLELVAARIRLLLALPGRVLPGSVDPAFAYDSRRGQYNSTRILERVLELEAELGSDEKIVGLAGVDLMIPILTFVFG